MKQCCKNCKYIFKFEKTSYNYSAEENNWSANKYKVLHCRRYPQTVEKQLDDYCGEYKEKGK